MAEKWDGPFPFGFPAAADSAGSVAAPFLAGFSFALVALLIPSPEHFRWPNFALLSLVAAGFAFIGAVQAGFWARQYAVTPDDIRLWRPEYPSGRMHALQRLHTAGFMKWNARMNWLYRAGMMLLLLGVTLSLVPPNHISWGRWVAIGVAVTASMLELLWILASWLLAGSPSMAYDDQPDDAGADIRFRRLRSQPTLRRAARIFVPLPRITLTDEERTTR
jgi:hypothetical protein